MSGRQLRSKRKPAGQATVQIDSTPKKRKISKSRTRGPTLRQKNVKSTVDTGAILIDSDFESDTEIQQMLRRGREELDNFFKAYSSDEENDVVDLTNTSTRNESTDDVVIVDISEPVAGPSQLRISEDVEHLRNDLLRDVHELLKELKPKPVEAAKVPTTTPPKEKIEPENSTPKMKIPDCAICFDSLVDSEKRVVTFCGHLFCKSCITHVIKTSHKCPLCRKALTLKKIHPVYLWNHCN